MKWLVMAVAAEVEDATEVAVAVVVEAALADIVVQILLPWVEDADGKPGNSIFKPKVLGARFTYVPASFQLLFTNKFGWVSLGEVRQTRLLPGLGPL